MTTESSFDSRHNPMIPSHFHVLGVIWTGFEQIRVVSVGFVVSSLQIAVKPVGYTIAEMTTDASICRSGIQQDPMISYNFHDLGVPNV
jgi:hypothetical protein